MTLAETADLLSIAAAIDKRTIGEADVRAWQMVLEDIPYSDAVSALKAHYRDTSRFLMPADIVTRICPPLSSDGYADRGIF